MPFTIHPDQKPSDDESYWRRYMCQDVEANAKLAAMECKNHAENVRCAAIMQRQKL